MSCSNFCPQLYGPHLLSPRHREYGPPPSSAVSSLQNHDGRNNLCNCFVQVIRSFFQDPKWNAAYDTSIPSSEELEDLLADGSFWRSGEIGRLAALIPILEKLNGAYELCLDWINPFSGVPYSVGIIGIRWELPHQNSHYISLPRAEHGVLGWLHLNCCQHPGLM